MTVREITDKLSLRILAGEGGLGRDIAGCYIGDLLSWVMSRCKECDIWLTVMGNVNAVAVAKLGDAACILLCEDSVLDAEAKAQADANDIAILSSPETAYDLSGKIRDLLG